MIVFNLSCSQRHTFDGWFRSPEEFVRQADEGQVECPVCGDKEIVKRLSAPHISASAGRRLQEDMRKLAPDAETAGPREVLPASLLPDLQQHMMQQFKEFVLTNTENVGGDFAETARRIHYGEEAKRNIRGRISEDEAAALRDEGIDTVSLPPGVLLDEGLQ
jgi:hypothetical protein